MVAGSVTHRKIKGLLAQPLDWVGFCIRFAPFQVSRENLEQQNFTAMALPYNPIIPVGGEAYVACPFNKEHWMTESSLQRHVIRCMAKYPDYVACPYNALHFFRNADILEKHMSACPCKPRNFDEENKERQEELIHGDLYNVKLWNDVLETWND